MALFKAQNATNYTVTAFSSLTGVNVSDIALDEPNNRVLAFDNTGKQIYRIDLNNTSASTTATLIPQTNTIAQANGFAYRNSRVIVTGNNGEIFTGILDGTAGNVTWTDNTQNTNPLPLQDIQYSGASGTVYAAGSDGKVLQRQSSGNWKTMVTGITKNINRIYFASASSGVIAGDEGLLTKFAVTATSINNGMLPVNNGPVTANLHDFILSGTTAYVAGENGTVLYTPDVINTPFAITNQNTSNDFYGLAFKPNTSQAYVVGENSKIHWCMGANKTVIKNIFTPALKDVHFADLNNGTLAGDNFTLRQTHDGGVTWEVILPNNTTINKVINRVWTINGNYALAIGDGKYMGVIENNIATEQPNSLFPGAGNNFLAIAFNPNEPLKGYIAGNQRQLRGITLTPSGSSFTISINNGIAQPVFTAPTIPNTTEIRALHVFDNNSVMAVGNNNFIGYYNTSAWVDLRNNSLPATTVYNDVYFHDHLNGYAVGNNGVMLRSTNTSLNPTTGYLTGTTWQQKSIIDGLNITANSQANITAIAFASRYNGVWGGSYNITNTTNKPYVRLIRDESELFSTYFWYDKLGRIVVSQNTKQRNGASSGGVQRFSYTLYDELGRVIEAGEKTENTTASTKFNSIFGTTVANYFNPKVIDDAKLLAWINDNTGPRKEVTKSYYDETVITGLPSNFNPNAANQRKRIVHVTYEEVYDGNDQTYDYGTHYDYDVHGNVKTLLQDNQKLANTYSADPNIVAQRFKRMDYTYDLISGNVHKVEYQVGHVDEWNHRYEYDADNRITQVETSTNKILWDKDAQYKYYAHGPLARTEIGDNQVQGCDYVYTLQGWIKGVNSNTLNENNDPGKDGTLAGSVPGNPNKNFARDVYGYSLNYYTGDYQSIDVTNQGTNSFTASIAGSDVEANRNDLFNGNIGSMITTITKPVTREILPLGNAYKYDQLNRLLQAVSYNNLDLNTSNSTFNTFGTGGTQMYYNAFTYDANGNIITQSRKDHTNAAIDNLQYRYAKDANGKTIQNRLYHVNDDTDYDANDIDDMGLFEDDLTLINQNNNYSYSEIGELKRDAQEEIEEIVWRVDSKVKKVLRTTASTKKNLIFDYACTERNAVKSK